MEYNENISNVVYKEEVASAILDSVSLDGNGKLTEDLSRYDNINQPLLQNRYVSVLSEYLQELSFGDEKWEDVTMRVPYDTSKGMRYLEYTDFPSAYFFGHKIILVGSIPYDVKDGEVQFYPDTSSPLRPILYDGRNHGLRLNEIAVKELGVDTKDGDVITTHQITSDNIQGVFLPIIRFRRVPIDSKGLRRKQLMEHLEQYHNPILLKEMERVVLHFLDNF